MKMADHGNKCYVPGCAGDVKCRDVKCRDGLVSVFSRHVHKSLRSKSKSSLKSLRSSLSQVSSL